MTQTIRDLNTRRAGFDPEFEAAAQRAQGVSGDFAQGLRSGGTSAMSQLNTLAGHGMNALGLDGSARLQRAAAGQQEAAQEAVGLTSFDQVDGVRNGLRWAAGAVGQSAPVMAAGLGAAALTGGGAVPALAAGTLATVPFELGDQLQRQDGVAGSERMTSGERLAQALPYAAGSAALQNIVPAGVAARIAGKATPGRVIGRALADVPANAAAEGGAELVRQTGEQGIDPTRTYDLEAAKRAAFEGGALGGALGLTGAVPHALHTAAAQPGNFVGSMKEKAGKLGETLGAQAQSLVGRAKDAATAVPGAVEGLDLGGKAQDAAQAVGGFVGRAKAAAEGLDLGGKVQSATEGFDLGTKASSAAEGVGAALGSLKDKGRKLMDRVASGEEFFDPESFAGKTEGALRGAVAEDGVLRQNAATKWASELPEKYLTPEVRQAASNLADTANQKVVAGARKAWQAAQDTAGSVKRLAEKFTPKAEPSPDGTKQSADYSGVNKAIVDNVAPYLTERAPHLLEDGNLQTLGPALRGAMTEMLSGKPLSADKLTALIDVTGEHTANVLDRVRQGMKVDDPKQLENFFNSATELLKVQEAHTDLLNTIRDSYVKGPNEVSMQDARQVAGGLIEWATKATGELNPAARAFDDARMRQQLRAEFGSKADAVLDAVDKLVPRKENMLAGTPDEAKAATVKSERLEGSDAAGLRSDEGEQIGIEEKPRLRTFGTLAKAEEFNPGKNGFKSAQAQALEKAQATHPGARWASADELGPDHYLVKAQAEKLHKQGQLERGLKGEGLNQFVADEMRQFGAVVNELPAGHLALDNGEVKRMAIDRGRDNSPSAVKVGDGKTVFDAVKITESMAKRSKDTEPYDPRDQRGGRDARMFADGIAALQDHLGVAFEVPDSTVINKQGLTWGDAQKLGVDRSKPGTKADVVLEQGLPEATDAELRATLQRVRAKWREAEDPKEAASLAKMGERVLAEIDRRKETELATGQTDPDPFGPTFQGTKGLDSITPTGITPERSRAPSLLGPSGAIAQKKGAASDLDAAAREAAKAFADPAPLSDTVSMRGEFRDYVVQQIRPGHLEVRDKRGDLVRTIKDAEGSPDPKAVAAKKAAFLERAASGDEALIGELKASSDVKGLQRAAEALAGAKLRGGALDTVNDRLRTLAEDPDNAYGMLTKKYSMEGVDPNATGPRDFKAAADYIRKVLGPKIKVAVANIMHAGEFVSRANVEDLIRISMHSLNPMSVAFHESMHGFIKNLTQAKGGDMVDVLRKAAESPSVMLALRAKLKDQPEALKQLNDPEERIAYMYQFHQLAKMKLTEPLGLGKPAQGVFGKIAEFIRSVLGVWSNDQRALHIMEYFHSGDYAKNMSKPDAVRQALMESGTNARLEWFKKATEPLRQLGEAVAVAGHQRLRDTGIPALNELADVIKRQGTSVGGDQGYLPTSRRERVTRMNEFAERLGNATDADMRDALGVLQGELAQAQTSEGKVAVHMTRKLLAETKAYMEAAGVEVGDLGPDYFPRVYDLSYISSNKDAFVDVLKTHGIKDPESVMQRLMTTEGAEFDVETSRPGMQHLKRRDLAKVPDAALAPFMQKDLMRIVDGYVTQATRRAEWARRFDADGKANAKFDQLLARARKEGASEADLQTATKYMMAVDGTLGDTISPEARRLQGNIMVYQNLRLLPLMIFSSVVDPAGIMVRGGSVGDAWRAFQRGIREIPKGFKKSPTHDDATKFAALIGTIESATLNHALGTSFSQGMVGDTGRAINDKLFKYNLVEQFNTSMRVAATEAAVNFIAKHADGKASPHSARWMAELGLEPGDVQLSPEGKLMASGNPKVAAAINQWVDGAVLRPDAADKPLWMSDPHFALIAHLKQFAFSFQETILKRVAHEAKHGNMAPAYALASYVPIMIAADATKALLTGNDLGDEEWGVEDYVGHGVERAGLLGVGQFPLDASQYGLSSMFGPTVEQLRKAAEVIGGDAEFAPFALKSMPANALYRGAFETGDVAEARFRE